MAKGDLLAKGEWTRSNLLFFLKIHDKGATARELAVYTGMVSHQVLEQLHNLERQGRVYSTPHDRNSRLWHLKPTLTPAAPSRTPQTRAPRRSR
jgi:predicted ArsR family transcriptional regulator